MAVCVGCGLFDPDDGINPVRVAVSAEWGDLGFAGLDTQGSPIYCDAAGELRTVPEHTSSTAEATGAGSGSVGDGGSASASAASLTVNNPSAVRACSVFVSWSMSLGVTFVNAAAAWTNKFLAEREAVEYFLLDNAQDPQNAAGGSMTFVQGANTVDSIVAGGSVDYELTVGVTMAAGTSGAFTAAAAIRALCVTQ